MGLRAFKCKPRVRTLKPDANNEPSKSLPETDIRLAVRITAAIVALWGIDEHGD